MNRRTFLAGLGSSVAKAPGDIHVDRVQSQRTLFGFAGSGDKTYVADSSGGTRCLGRGGLSAVYRDDTQSCARVPFESKSTSPLVGYDA